MGLRFPQQGPGAADSPFLLGGLYSTRWDYISVSYPSATVETYTFKRQGASGDTVLTMTIEYTDATKENLLTVTKVFA